MTEIERKLENLVKINYIAQGNSIEKFCSLTPHDGVEHTNLFLKVHLGESTIVFPKTEEAKTKLPIDQNYIRCSSSTYAYSYRERRPKPNNFSGTFCNERKRNTKSFTS